MEKSPGNASFDVSDIDPYSSISSSDYVPDYLGINKLGPVTIICGQSNSGKSVILNNLFKHKLVHEYDPKDIYFFSKTVRGDLKYKPLFKYLAGRKTKINIYDKVDFAKINEIVKGQETVGMNQMFAQKKEDEPELKNIVFVFDDMLSDKAFKHHTSDLSGFSCLCRHYGVSLIILTQKWSAVPDTI